MSSQPRYGRLALLCSAVGVTLVSVLGGLGALPSSADDRARTPAADGLVLSGAATAPTPTAPDPTASVTPSTVEHSSAATTVAEALPADSGTGRRVVFSEGLQRVWLVDRGGRDGGREGGDRNRDRSRSRTRSGSPVEGAAQPAASSGEDKPAGSRNRSRSRRRSSGGGGDKPTATETA